MDKVVIIGPESTGKSSLSAALAAHFRAPWVPEYAREYLQQLHQPYTYEDLLQIARGQLASEDQQAAKADELLFCDTDLRVIRIWSDYKYGKTHPWIQEQIEERAYDLYLLTDIDIPWQEDPLREHPDPILRKYFLEQYERELAASGVSWVKISGTPTVRLEAAVQAIRAKLGRSPHR
jgi:NadR type nicotinamide-nucleotide adenylyltransferase